MCRLVWFLKTPPNQTDELNSPGGNPPRGIIVMRLMGEEDNKDGQCTPGRAAKRASACYRAEASALQHTSCLTAKPAACFVKNKCPMHRNKSKAQTVLIHYHRYVLLPCLKAGKQTQKHHTHCHTQAMLIAICHDTA